jgi:DNA-binding PadR family transcriptional regulator
MSRSKPKKDPRGGHARLYWSMLDSPAWRVLTHADVRVYVALRRKLGATNNGDINATLAEMKHAGISSSSTLSAALHRLEALGFIEKTRQGGIAHGGKMCSLFRFTDEGTFDIAKAGVRAGPATNEWTAFKNMADARAAVRGFARKSNAKVRSPNRSGSTIDAESAVCASTVERVADSPVRSAKRNPTSQKPLQPA